MDLIDAIDLNNNFNTLKSVSGTEYKQKRQLYFLL